MMTRQAAIRMKCNDCAAGDGTAIRCCPILDCSLWNFRMGYASRRTKLYYDKDLYREHEEVSQEEFNRMLKQLQMTGKEIS